MITFRSSSWLHKIPLDFLNPFIGGGASLDLPFDPAIPLLGIYPKDCDTGYSRGTCTPMFIVSNVFGRFTKLARLNLEFRVCCQGEQ
jgi:hypothetical protein